VDWCARLQVWNSLLKAIWQYIRAKFRRNLIAFLHWALLCLSIFSNIPLIARDPAILLVP
jgi:hypothetical protein